MTKVLVTSGDRVGNSMAGPAIRSWEMCRHLAAHGHEVRLAVEERGDREPEGFEIVLKTHETLAEDAIWAEVIVVQGLVLLTNPELKMGARTLVVDLYDPFNLEVLESFHDHPFDERRQQHDGHLYALLEQLHVGDFFICASEKQRDYWLGMLSGAGRVNPYNHDKDRLLRNLIDIVPFGTQDNPPKHSGTPAARGVLPGIGVDDQLVVWGGGVYNWFDPLSLLRAWPAILKRAPRARLLFMGLQHPNPDVPAMAMAAKAIALSEELGLRDESVHFNLGWVPYDRRQDFLLEATIGVSMHFDHIETAFSFRTRILDYIWAGLPVVATEGDEFARWIRENGTGRVVRYEDPASIAEAIGDLLTQPDELAACVRNVRAQQPEFTWEAALAPLVAYCAEPWRAPDLAAKKGSSQEQEEAAKRLLGSMLAPRGVVARALFFLRREGPLALVGRVVATLRRRARGRA